MGFFYFLVQNWTIVLFSLPGIAKNRRAGSLHILQNTRLWSSLQREVSFTMLPYWRQDTLLYLLFITHRVRNCPTCGHSANYLKMTSTQSDKLHSCCTLVRLDSWRFVNFNTNALYTTQMFYSRILGFFQLSKSQVHWEHWKRRKKSIF